MKQLEKGQEFRNYRELCGFLGEPTKGGNSKKAQISEWGRHFAYERQGNRYVITDVYEPPLPKAGEKRGGNNCKNIRPMMRYLLLKGAPPDGGWHSRTYWYCDVLDLLHRDACTAVYLDSEDDSDEDSNKVEKYCKCLGIEDPKLMTAWISAVRQTLKKMLDASLRSMERKGLVSYRKGYHFFCHAAGCGCSEIYIQGLEDRMKEMEASACDKINEKAHLSQSQKGRQLLWRIYRSEKMTWWFKHIMRESIMEDAELVKEISGGAEECTVKFYNEAIIIDGMAEAPMLKSDSPDLESERERLAGEITGIVIRKAWKRMYNLMGENYLVDFSEIGKINKFLFKHRAESGNGRNGG